MKATDLMIGDWVQYTYTPYGQNEPRTLVFQVSEIECFSDAGLYFACSVKEGRVCKVEDLQPVDLTPEILEKNGFKGRQFYGELLQGGWQILCDCSHLAMRHEAGWIIDIPCDFVHQLQNALRLCGIEKEIII